MSTFPSNALTSKIIMQMLETAHETIAIHRIAMVYQSIDWNDQNQDIQGFLTYLESVFLPFLAKGRPKMLDIDTYVDTHLSKRCPGKTLAIILAELRQHCRRPAQNCASGPEAA